MKQPSAKTAVTSWIGRQPGREGLLRINVASSDSAHATLDDFGSLHFGLTLHPVLPLDVEALRPRFGEYTDGEISLVVCMNAPDHGEPYLCYADLDHDAIVPLFAVSADTFLSEQGEELTFSDDGKLRMSIENASVEMWEAKEPRAEAASIPVADADTALEATLLRPHACESGPAVVITPDSRIPQRDFYRVFAHAMVRAGMTVLIFDHLGRKESAPSSARLDAAAAEAALDFLSARDDVTSVGLWGLGESMWTVPLVASRRPDVAFVAGVGAPGVTMVAAESYRRARRLQDAGMSAESAAVAAKAWRLLLEAEANGKPESKTAAKLDELLDQLRNDPDAAQLAAAPAADDDPLPPAMPPLDPAAQTLKQLADEPNVARLYDPADSYRELVCPVLLQYGAADGDVPVDDSMQRVRSALTDKAQLTLTCYDDAGGMLEVNPARAAGISRDRLSRLAHGFRFAPGALDELIAWMRERVDASGASDEAT